MPRVSDDAHHAQIDDESSCSGAERNATRPQRLCGRQNTRPDVREGRCLSGAVLPPACLPPPPRPLQTPLLLLFRHPLHLLLATAAAKWKGLWRPFDVGALRDPLNTLRRVLQRRQECVPSNLQNKQNSELIFHAQVVRGIYMYMQHAVFRHKATPLIVAPY